MQRNNRAATVFEHLTFEDRTSIVNAPNPNKRENMMGFRHRRFPIFRVFCHTIGVANIRKVQ